MGKIGRVESRSASYPVFARRHFPSVYRWCSEHCRDVDETAHAAQRIVLELYRLESAVR